MDTPKPDKTAAAAPYLDLERIRAGREKLDLSMDQAAVRAGFGGQRPGTRWNQIEKGHIADPTLSTLFAIAKAIELAPADLLVTPPRAAKVPRRKPAAKT